MQQASHCAIWSRTARFDVMLVLNGLRAYSEVLCRRTSASPKMYLLGVLWGSKKW